MEVYTDGVLDGMFMFTATAGRPFIGFRTSGKVVSGRSDIGLLRNGSCRRPEQAEQEGDGTGDGTEKSIRPSHRTAAPYGELALTTLRREAAAAGLRGVFIFFFFFK